jgi:DNA invertase Pin-like site-specific DNA recombinase
MPNRVFFESGTRICPFTMTGRPLPSAHGCTNQTSTSRRSETIKAAIYGRVSTTAQDTNLQLREVRQFVQRRGWQIAEEYIDKGISGSREKRPALDKLMSEAKRRRFDAVVVYRYDRFARSLRHLVNALEEFRALGIEFVSIHEGVDTSTPNGRLVFGIFASIAEFERELIRARVRSGLAAAKARGIQLGRPALRKFTAKEIKQLRRDRRKGMPFQKLAQLHGTSVWTAFQICKRRLKLLSANLSGRKQCLPSKNEM